MSKQLFKVLFGGLLLFAMTAFTGCKDDENAFVVPELKLSPEVLTFEVDSQDPQIVEVKANCAWTLTLHDLSWATVQIDGKNELSANGDATLTIYAEELDSNLTGRRGTITFALMSEFGSWGDSESVLVINQGAEISTAEPIFFTNFDKEEATKTYGSGGTSWPYLDQFEGWKNHEGTGAADVTYSFSGVSARANSGSDSNYSDYSGSGSNNIFFGANGVITIEKIAIPSTNLTLSFGTERYLNGDNDNTFKHEEFNVTLSADGSSWSAPLNYEFALGVDPNGRWDEASADFSLPEGTTTLYVRFASTLASAHRLDDVKLVEGFGGQEITFDNQGGGGNEGGGNEGGETGDAIFTTDFDQTAATQTYGTSGTSWPYLDQFEGWKNHSGSGATNVTYDFAGASARANSTSDGTYSDYSGSGANNIFFGTGAYFTIEKIAVSSQNLKLTFGAERYSQSAGNDFKHEDFLVELSKDGSSWSSPLEYSFAKGTDPSGRWDLATANFTLPSGTSTLYIRFTSKVASAHRLDDVTLTTGNGGQTVDFGNGGGGNEGGGDDTDAIFTSNFDKTEATKTYGSGSSWPYLDQFEGWKNHSGSGATNVTYDFAGASTRANSTSDGNYSDYSGSGKNNIFFGTDAYFTIEKIAVSSQNLKLTFGAERYSQSAGNDFKYADFLVELSKDGSAWSSPLEYSFAKGTAPSGRWDLATANFTLPSGTSTLYIRFTSKVASAHRLDDVTLTTGDGGQDVTFGEGGGNEGGGETGDVVTMTIPELFDLAAGASTKTVLNADSDVVFEAVVVTDKEGGNYSSKQLMVMTEGATTPKNGIMLYGSGQYTDPSDANFTFAKGDKVKVTLKKGQAKYTNYKGQYELTGDQGADWILVEKIGTATVKSVELSDISNLSNYFGMAVTIKNVTSPATAAAWTTAENFGQHTFKVGSSNLTVFVAKNAAAFVGKEFKVSTTGALSGYATAYNNTLQVCPQQLSDVADFTDGEGGGEEGGGEGGDTGSTTGFKRVTTITPGKSYLIVAETSAKNYLFDASQIATSAGRPNGVEVTISNETIEANATNKAYAVTIETVGNGYSIKTQSGTYVEYNGSSTTLKTVATAARTWLTETTDKNTIKFVDEDTKTANTADGKSTIRCLLFQHNDTYQRFGGYADQNADNGEYYTVALYELNE